MTVTVNQFVALTSPNSDPFMWSEGQNFGVVDNVTGDLCLFSYTSADTNVKLHTSQNNGATWVLKATVNVGVRNGLLSVCQDVTNGVVHALLFDNSGITNARGYARWALTRASSHVTGFTVTTSFALTTHTNADIDPKGNIYVFKFGGAERLAYIYGYATTAGPVTDLVEYAAESSSLTPSSSASFTGLDGSGSDSLMVNLTDATGIRTNHAFSAWLVQETSTEHLYLIVGHVYSPDTLLVSTAGAINDCWYKQCAKGASGWTVPTATTAGTAFVSDNGSKVPNVMAVYTGVARAYVMYMSPANGVKYSYLDSSAVLNTVSASPLSTANRGGFGTFTVDSSNNIYTIFNTEGVSGALALAGKYAFYDSAGTSWSTNVANASPTDSITIAGFGVWASGCVAAQFVGDSVAQTVTGVVNGAAIFSSGSGPIIMGQACL